MHHHVTDNIEDLLALFPAPFLKLFYELSLDPNELLEIIVDLGRVPEIRLQNNEDIVLGRKETTSQDLAAIVEKVGGFDDDNRAGIPRTLHRISAIRNRKDEVIGLTCRVGRAVYGVVDIIRDLIDSGKSVLLLGAPGVGKTTMLRESARILADQEKKRVVIIDTSNEIAGDGDIPHQGIGRSRRMQVKRPADQHKVMIEAVQNHMPQVIVIDEIGIVEETFAARTIAERGVQLIGTAHGITLENLTMNPTLVDLVGGIQTVTLSDEEAYRRQTQKSVLERMRPPTFDCVVEIIGWEQVRIHYDTAQSVDALLAHKGVVTELRTRDARGKIKTEKVVVGSEIVPKQQNSTSFFDEYGEYEEEFPKSFSPHPKRVYVYGIKRRVFAVAAEIIGSAIEVTRDIEQADAVVTLKNLYKKRPKIIRKAEIHGMPVYLLREETPEELVRILERMR